MKLLELKIWFHKKMHWEYWHARAIYIPLLWAWFYCAIRNRSLYFFNYTNPSISYGGFAMCSKKEIYDLIPSRCIPKTLKFNHKDSVEKISTAIDQFQMSFPLVLKPDIGLKGLGVHFIENYSQLEKEVKNLDSDYLIQEKIPYKNEVGIFYVRYPNEKDGFCTGMVRKDFLSVRGNGSSTLEELILNDSRAFVHYKSLYREWSNQWNSIVEKDKTILLVPYGSHTRGACFKDVSNSMSTQLSSVINSICKEVNGFYYGRLDVMYKDWESLLAGKDFSIIEINGTAAEPTHIFDSKHSYFFGAKTIIKHWMMMSKISRINRNSLETASFKKTTKALFQNIKLERQLRLLHGL